LAAIPLLIAVISVIFVAGIVQGLAGFGSALVAVPILALLLPIETVVPLMTLLGCVMASVNLLHLRQSVSLRPVLPLLAGYALGTPLGLAFLIHAPRALVLGSLGLSISVYALASLAGRQPRAPWLRKQRLALGTLSGALGSAFSTNGPPIILHVAAHTDWGPDRQKALLSLFFLLSNLITLATFATAGLITRDALTWFLWSLPTLLGGTFAGVFLYRRLGERDYRRLTFLIILATGTILVVRSLWG